MSTEQTQSQPTRCWSSTKQTITWCAGVSLQHWIRHILSLPPASVTPSHSPATNTELGSWRPFQIEYWVSAIQAIITEIILLSSSSSPLSRRVSSWFDFRNVDNTPPPPTPAHLMVKLKRSWWFNLKQSRINSNLLAGHRALWPRQTLCIVVSKCCSCYSVSLSLLSPPQHSWRICWAFYRAGHAITIAESYDNNTTFSQHYFFSNRVGIKSTFWPGECDWPLVRTVSLMFQFQGVQMLLWLQPTFLASNQPELRSDASVAPALPLPDMWREDFNQRTDCKTGGRLAGWRHQPPGPYNNLISTIKNHNSQG